MMDSFYVPPENIRGEIFKIIGEEAHHISHVLRYDKGDHLCIVDGCGHKYEASLINIHNSYLECRLESEIPQSNEPSIQITLAQALPKGKKLEEIIRKGTEVGISQFMPTTTERTLVSYNKFKWSKLSERWQRIALSAMKQSGRSFLPLIHPPQSLTDIFKSKIDVNLKLIASVFKATCSIRDILQKYDQINSMLICIGPEGGFSEGEILEAQQNGFLSLSLGKRRLRTETAGLITAGIFCSYYD